MRLVYAATTTWVGAPNGATIDLVVGDVWDADDELVKARPDLFTDEPVRVKTSRGTVEVIETATAAPGETRRRR